MEMQMHAQQGSENLRHSTVRVRALGVAVLLACAGVLTACSSGGNISLGKSQVSDPATVDYPIFYVKRPVPLNADGTFMQDDLRLMNDIVPVSADLYMRASASPAAVETNVTSRITAGAMWDVKDVDTSADGTRVIFAMRGPLAMKQKVTKPPSWRVYEYIIATDDLHPVIDPSSDPDPPTVNDESPHYLPDGRVVFSTTRQSQSQGILLDEGFPQFSYQDEARQEEAFVLEVMNDDSTAASSAHQISFNQSHDRDATVLTDGRVLWTRWDNSPGGRDQMSLYSSNPDGTDLELYYGANSHNLGTNNTTIEFSHPRQMQDGRILAISRQYTDVDDGGDLVIIDGTHYVENTQALLGNPGLVGPAQVPATQNDIVTIPGPSPGGRFTSAYPLQDGTGRILVSWTQCRLLDTTQTPATVVPCTSANLNVAKPTVAPPLYSVWMFDPAQNTLQPIMAPVEGTMITDVAVAQPRPLQNIILDKVPGVNLDQDLVTAGVGVIDIRSVYDIDGVDTANPNIATLANPIDTPASSRPARFIRLEKAVSIPDRTVVDLAGAAFGASNYMMQILGYAPIEPDGSVHIEVPANVAFRMEILDANARRIAPVQGVWLQLIPGEVVTCNGCHKPGTTQHPISHGREGLFNPAWPGAAVGGTAFPGTISSGAGAFIPNQGETMAQARMRVSCATDTPPCAQMVPSVDVLYTDVWTDPAQATPGAPINLRYDDATQFMTAFPTSALCVTAWASNCRIIINYTEHLQPLWDLTRQVTDPTTGAVVSDHTCTQGGCHSPTNAAGAAQMPAGNLDLTKSTSSDAPPETTSYRQLLFAHNIVIMDPTPTDPTHTITQSVGPYLNAGSANGGLSAQFMSRFAAGSASTHAGWLSPDELRLVSEWLDIGAQYFNNPFDPAVPVN
jgi:Hydrazine synthase alpha subunit middle domain